MHDGCKSFDECPTLEEARMYNEIESDSEEQDSDEYNSEEENDGDEARQELADLKDNGSDEEIADDARDLAKHRDDDDDENCLDDGNDQDA